MGKKQKSKKGKLLKMSDEERARYFQHKAEQEEEAKRRREQLVKAWMIKKMKKEQAFSRLNLAKINTHWLQFFRKIKVKEMREEIKYLQEWLDYILTLKNRIINNLVVELQEAEAQYSYNFKAHCIHIENFTDFHNNWVSELQNLFDEDRYEMTELYLSNMDEFKKRSEENEEYLKTIIFAQTKNADSLIRDDYEYFMKRNYEAMKHNEETLRHMITSREAACTSLWRRIAHSVRQYVRRTDTRRHHMAELRKMDAESATEISENQERIIKLEESIKQLKKHIDNSTKDSKLQLEQTKTQEKNKTLELIRKRKELKRNNESDNKKIIVLTTRSNISLEQLNRILRTVEHCLFLLRACRKYETPHENLNKWMNKEIGLKYPYVGLPQLQDSSLEVWDNKEEEELMDDFILEGTKLFSRIDMGQLNFEGPKTLIDTKKIISRIFPARKATSKRSSAPSKLFHRSGKIRPETCVSHESKLSSTSHDLLSTNTDRPDVSTLSRIVIQAKETVSSQSNFGSTPSRITEEGEAEDKEDLDLVIDVDIGIGHLEKLDSLWNLQSKVLVDIKELKGEKKYLRYENEQLKVMLRLVLEAAALRKGHTGNDTDSYVSSSIRSSSATFQTIYN